MADLNSPYSGLWQVDVKTNGTDINSSYSGLWQVDVRTNGTVGFPPATFNGTPSDSLSQWMYYNQTALPSSVPAEMDPTSVTQLLISRNFNASNVTHEESWITAEMIGRIRPWLDIPESFVTGNPEDWRTFSEHAPSSRYAFSTAPYAGLACPEPECTSHDICKLFYQCFFEAVPSIDEFRGNDSRSVLAANLLDDCLRDQHIDDERDVLRCGIIIMPTYIRDRDRPFCPGTLYRGTRDDWISYDVDVNLQRFITGGFDTEFVYWPGQSVDGPFSQALGGRLTQIANYQCSLEIPCAYQYVCDQIGSWTAARLGKEVSRSPWGLLALTALQNINQQLTNQYIAIKGALGVLALDTFLISDFFPEADGQFDILNALTGLGTILSIISGFVPVTGPGLSAFGAVLPAVGSFLGDSLASKDDPLVGQKTFAPKVRQVYGSYVDALDSAAAALFKGEKVGGRFNITDMMANGAWADTTSITKLTGLESNLTIEILSRSIDALWKTPTSNKMWVLFSDLADDASLQKCLGDKSGPQSTKYCGDQGVYYTYNFVEDGAERGHVDYPWGGDKLQEKLGINLTVTTMSHRRHW
ncbi:MAG: hypothetical protein Q9184_002494 [Pyrenodesmia sp. 2 TL-2023]